MRYEYIDTPRSGDHICYISDLATILSHCPEWSITKDLPTTLTEIHDAWVARSDRRREVADA
jgi:CDP-paratose 2-epimerase